MVVPSGTTRARPSLQQPARRLDAVSTWHVHVHPVDIQTGLARRVDELPEGDSNRLRDRNQGRTAPAAAEDA